MTQIHYKLLAKRITGVACKHVEALRRAHSRWLALMARNLSARTDGPSTTASPNGGISEECCEPGLQELDKEAVTIMWAAVRRGATRLELARAAVATARAVLPMIQDLQFEATAVVEASEALVLSSREEETKAVSRARGVLNARCDGKLADRELITREDWALTAVDAAAMACSFLVYNEILAVSTVKCGCHAAGNDIDVASVVMASLL